MSRQPLLLGIIRRSELFRANNAAGRDAADAEFKAVRTSFLAKSKYTCSFCGYRSEQEMEVHHQDGNHANNSEANFAGADFLCHGYHHLGERARSNMSTSDNLGDKTLVAALPEVEAADLNLLFRALGAALADPAELPIAKDVYAALVAPDGADRIGAAERAYGTSSPASFAAAMEQMEPGAYEARMATVGGLRLIPKLSILRDQVGGPFLKAFPSLHPSTWRQLVYGTRQRFKS